MRHTFIKLCDCGNLCMQIGVVNSCYVVPREGGRDRLQQARASAEYHGRRVNSNLAMRSPEGEAWYAKAYLFFKATEKTTVWNQRTRRREASNKVHSLVFVRWFKVTGYTDAIQCEILERASKPQCPPGTPWVTVEDIGSLKSVEMIMPKHTFTRGKVQCYRNVWLR
jgi:hypothetical protein